MEEKTQDSASGPESQAKEVGTFNPHWNEGEFLGPNTFRQKKGNEKYGEGES